MSIWTRIAQEFSSQRSLIDEALDSIDALTSAPEIVATAGFYVNASSGINVTIPTDVEAGDVLIIQTLSSWVVNNIPAGWRVALGGTGAWVSQTVLIKGAAGTEGGTTVNVGLNGSDAVTAYITVVRGATAVDSFSRSDSDSNDVASLVLNASARVGALLIVAAAYRTGGTTINLGVQSGDGTATLLQTRSADASFSSKLMVVESARVLPVITSSPASGSAKAGMTAVCIL